MKPQRTWGQRLLSLFLGSGVGCGVLLLVVGILFAWWSAQSMAQLPPNVPGDALVLGYLGGLLFAVVGALLFLVFGIIVLIRRLRHA